MGTCKKTLSTMFLLVQERRFFHILILDVSCVRPCFL
jgi:hypothetical protein